MAAPGETFISVDVETAGPYPEDYSLLSIGACLVDEPGQGFYAELAPRRAAVEQLAHQGKLLSLETLSTGGTEPDTAFRQLAGWIRSVVPAGRQPIMVAFNAAHDWAFVSHYFYRYLGENPLGRSPIDIRALYMGLVGCAWEETSMLYVSARFLKGHPPPHDALADAQLQAELFSRLVALARRRAPLPSWDSAAP